MWLVVIPATRLVASDESERTRIVGKIAKRFGEVTNVVLPILVLSGIYNAAWYLPSPAALLDTRTGNLLLVKMSLVAALILLIYLHNVHFGKRIIQLARERRLEELRATRRWSQVVSAANILLMVLILLFAVLLQMPM